MSSFQSLFGFETEYGITVEGSDASGLIKASREVIKSYDATQKPFASPWNYRSEDPRNDQRGFHVERLTIDTVDAQFDRPGERAASPQEDRCDHVLTNGARLYNDHGHPEYATPECADLRTLVAHDKAGERIVLECAKIYGAQIGKGVEIWKNNTDFHGASYGSHESYLIQRRVSWDTVVKNLAPFLATRIIFCGAGKVGSEERGIDCRFQISQRADFFNVLQSVDTLSNRPLVNTRDEPHGDARRFRRLHVIAGDANLSEWAIAMRAGTTNLVAALIESGWENPHPLRDSVKAIKAISRDETYAWKIESERGEVSAIEVQRGYLEGAKSLNLAGSEWVLGEWQEILDVLGNNPFDAFDRCDWVAKKSLLDQFIETEELNWKDDKEFLQSLDLAYHNVDPELGLYAGLVESGAMRTLVTEEEIEAARNQAPSNTRASLRGAIAKKFGSQIHAISWGGGEGKDAEGNFRFALPEEGDFAELVKKIEAAQNLRDVFGG
ncbi:proteasome accessory factor A [Abditibacterium utsteinense]|uniref:Proteasome accessory factor A n=1 Tax=Abditibacterium utsteinense TaxID=1960156 RepID=A0A2S8STZ6_9BACT|nr:proteasome accessory factor PafA2 family protein [Abditibacterium utsteinense]PQV64256.1 proteasome accessory factor A [Abditibacterium utsteinense]